MSELEGTRAAEGELKNGRLLLADRYLDVLGGQQGLLHDLFDTVVMVSDEQSLMAARLVAAVPENWLDRPYRKPSPLVVMLGFVTIVGVVIWRRR